METFLVDQNLSIKIPPASVPYIQDMVSHYQTCALRAPSIAHPNSPMIHQANAFVGTPALRSRDLTHGNGRSLNLGHRHQVPLLEEGLPSGSFTMTSPAQYANLPPKPRREVDEESKKMMESTMALHQRHRSEPFLLFNILASISNIFYHDSIEY